jgi:uncharacterized alkaline shock family protein YloU
MPERSVAGRSIVTRRAIVDIVRTAVQGSYGVTGFADRSLGRRLLRWLGLDRSGIKLAMHDGLRFDLYITVAAGVPVAEVARQVDSAVRYSLRHYVGSEAASVSIHVDGLRFQPLAIERAEAIERTDTVEQTGAAGAASGPEAIRRAAEGATAPRKRTSR